MVLLTLKKSEILLYVEMLLWYFALPCNFPDFLQTSKDELWSTRISSAINTRTFVSIKGGAIEYTQEDDFGGRVKLHEFRCMDLYDLRKFIVSFHKPGEPACYRCIEFVPRGKSIVQVRLSNKSSTPGPRLCMDYDMELDPWPLVSYSRLEKEFQPCPLSGGFNMKITDSTGAGIGCNYMHLPMRFEIDCLGGEGVVLDFRSPHCVGNMQMDTVQTLTCVTHWATEDFIFTVVRDSKRNQVSCLRIPIVHSDRFQVHLFKDFACPTGIPSDSPAFYYTVDLEAVQRRKLCDDEYKECPDITCNNVVKNQCLKSCGICDENKPPDVCAFPKRYRGLWYQRDQHDVKNIEISESKISIAGVGTFTCVDYEDSPPRESRMYSTVSVFENGCRPRYTCIQFQRKGPSVIAYSLSQSLKWPLIDDHPGSAICDRGQFQPDNDPVSDSYRSYIDTLKPIVSRLHLATHSCRLGHVYNIDITMTGGKRCSGEMYEDCKNDTTLRIDISGCGARRNFLDYQCISVFEGRYWEKIVLLQNINDLDDASCLVFTEIKNEIILLPASECHKLSWSYVDAGERQPLARLSYSVDAAKCKFIPIPTTTSTTTTTTTTTTKPPPKAESSSDEITPDLFKKYPVGIDKNGKKYGPIPVSHNVQAHDPSNPKVRDLNTKKYNSGKVRNNERHAETKSSGNTGNQINSRLACFIALTNVFTLHFLSRQVT